MTLLQGLRFGSLSPSEKKLEDQCAVAGGVGSQRRSEGAWGENTHEKQQKGIETDHPCLSVLGRVAQVL